MCLTEKICTLDKLCSGMSYSAAGHDVNVNESTIYIKWLLKRNIHKTTLCTDQLTKML